MANQLVKKLVLHLPYLFYRNGRRKYSECVHKRWGKGFCSIIPKLEIIRQMIFLSTDEKNIWISKITISKS